MVYSCPRSRILASIVAQCNNGRGVGPPVELPELYPASGLSMGSWMERSYSDIKYDTMRRVDWLRYLVG